MPRRSIEGITQRWTRSKSSARRPTSSSYRPSRSPLERNTGRSSVIARCSSTASSSRGTEPASVKESPTRAPSPGESLLGSRSRPDRPLILRLDRPHTLVDELLHPFSLVGLGRVDVALRVGRDAVDREELSRLTAAVSEARENLERLAVHHVDLLVLAVGDVDVLLLRVLREGDVPDGAVSQGLFGDEGLLHERSILLEDLEPVVRPVADVHEPVVRGIRAVDRIAELLGGSGLRIVRSQVFVVGLVPVGAPEPFELAGVHVDDRDALVEVSVRDVSLVRRCIESDLRDAAEVLLVQASADEL